jgi:hypothetical protein
VDAAKGILRACLPSVGFGEWRDMRGARWLSESTDAGKRLWLEVEARTTSPVFLLLGQLPWLAAHVAGHVTRPWRSRGLSDYELKP